MGEDTMKVKVVIRGFVGAVQLVERTMTVESAEIAWEYVAVYFSTEATRSECDRHTVDTYWVC